MTKTNLLIALAMCCTTSLVAQKSDPLAEGLAGVAQVVGETKTPETANDSAASASTDSAVAQGDAQQIPTWKKKLYYGYNFDIYFHHDTRNQTKENGWSFTLEPEIGWRLKERLYLGMRFGGTYQDVYTSYSYQLPDESTVTENLRIQMGSWNVTPYMRYRLKTIFNDKVGIWLEAHLYGGMEFPRVTDGVIKGTDYEGLKHSIIYGAQVSPVITYQFNRKSTFQIFFSILSFGYSGTTFCYVDPVTGNRHNEFTNDVIIFSGKLRNLIANQFTPGLYGLKFGIQKSF